MPVVSRSEWGDFLKNYPEAHILQTNAWGEFKQEFGWESERIIINNTGSQVLFRKLPLGFSMAYLPKGPIGENWKDLLTEVLNICKTRRTIFLKIEPDKWEEECFGIGEKEKAESLLLSLGFHRTDNDVQPQRTLIVDLSPDDEQILGNMKQKTRYNIRLAKKKGVVVNPTNDVPSFYKLMELTGVRDGFGIHSEIYYRRVFDIFYPSGECQIFSAEFDEKKLASLMAFSHGKRAWYFYGASADIHRELMPTYLLQWEAMLWAKRRGCVLYDLWGVPDEDEKTLEADFLRRTDNLWGVYRFKRGFGGKLCRSIGAWDFIFNKGLYSIYQLAYKFRGGLLA